jgi:hypothetical protein
VLLNPCFTLGSSFVNEFRAQTGSLRYSIHASTVEAVPFGIFESLGAVWAFWIALKFLYEFSDVVFLGVDVDWLLGEAEVWSRRTRVPVRKNHNF